MAGHLFNAERVRELVSLLRSRSGSNPTTSVAWRWTLQIVKRSDTVQGFEVIPRRWVVERTLAWLGRCRRMAKDWEKPSRVQRHGSSTPTSGASRGSSQGQNIS